MEEQPAGFEVVTNRVKKLLSQLELDTVSNKDLKEKLREAISASRRRNGDDPKAMHNRLRDIANTLGISASSAPDLGNPSADLAPKLIRIYGQPKDTAGYTYGELFHIIDLVEQQRSTDQETLKKNATEISNLTRERDNAVDKQERTEVERNKWESRATTAESNEQTVKGDRNKLTTELDQARNDVKRLQTDLQSANEDSQKLQADFDSKKTEFENLQKARTVTQNRYLP